MTGIVTLKAWVRQARADYNVAESLKTSSGAAECHCRYFYQQACEKSFKAFGLLIWKGHSDERGDFQKYFLHRHDPLKKLASETGLPSRLKLLLNQIRSDLGLLDNFSLLEKIDSTTASTDPNETSYRYPFVDPASGRVIAPADASNSSWNAYQGNKEGVSAAVGRLVEAVEERVKRERAPG